MLKKNTEQVGSIFDAQPSQLFGNIRSTTKPDEIVIGFISAGTVTQKRILLIANDFPFPFVGPLPDPGCIELAEEMKTQLQYDMLLGGKEYIPITDVPPPLTATKHFECVDCRLQGGTNIVPPYWIY
jgi:hypothetical protein